jgi:hypothetical protein
MRLVVLESPYAGDVEANTIYAKICLMDCLVRNEAPVASHLLYPQVLNDLEGEERSWGLRAGWAWIKVCDAVVVYTDRGVSPGMLAGIEYAKTAGKPVEYRTIPVIS